MMRRKPRAIEQGTGHLLAAGDSWFNYFPPFDALVALQRKYGYTVHSVALPKTKLAELAAPIPAAADSTHQLSQLQRAAQALSPAEKRAVTAILISGGGNDVVDPTIFPTLLNPAAPGRPALNQRAFDKFVNEQLGAVLLQVLKSATEISRSALGRTVPIVIHGYDHPVPDGRTLIPATGLRHMLAAQGYVDLPSATDVMRLMIDGLNDMQKDLLSAHAQDLAHVVRVDLRGVLNTDLAGGYKADWQNEIHPTIPRGFTLVADALQAQLLRLRGAAAANNY
jgi:hypothetical protein